ncbi:hypothetical protein [Deinococcus sp. RM]|uniref:hypothetical protein n=1 Tax=Deinococcus sp. RM TaxID=2316359 RepID=UPI0011C22AAF|nr:hypothetical protein [Deinococcus sp. RM]
MKRVALLCLITLTACTRSDPSGTIQPSDKGVTEVPDVVAGDSGPFRLSGGDTIVFFVASADGTQGCSPTLTLIPYGSQDGTRVPTNSDTLGRTRLNGIKPGVYFLRTDTAFNFCQYRVMFSKA